ncbi:hypothetical protein [Desmospora activa]|uniref:Uncharacterized protein n=1 Tax=Desmospora activa DSM 45169 TaxID=1121389 RepID=A0A2T4Z8Y8_9BACL|nr:hypothetical protein [Desmospora activa]PTM58361.1 hypothetical protein C8J48_0943 [Desmospora activa DSM 45169]
MKRRRRMYVLSELERPVLTKKVTVSYENRCPYCGEDRIENIQRLRNGWVRCSGDAGCGKIYQWKTVEDRTIYEILMEGAVGR